VERERERAGADGGGRREGQVLDGAGAGEARIGVTERHGAAAGNRQAVRAGQGRVEGERAVVDQDDRVGGAAEGYRRGRDAIAAAGARQGAAADGQVEGAGDGDAGADDECGIDGLVDGQGRVAAYQYVVGGVVQGRRR